MAALAVSSPAETVSAPLCADAAPFVIAEVSTEEFPPTDSAASRRVCEIPFKLDCRLPLFSARVPAAPSAASVPA